MSTAPDLEWTCRGVNRPIVYLLGRTSNCKPAIILPVNFKPFKIWIKLFVFQPCIVFSGLKLPYSNDRRMTSSCYKLKLWLWILGSFIKLRSHQHHIKRFDSFNTELTSVLWVAPRTGHHVIRACNKACTVLMPIHRTDIYHVIMSFLSVTFDMRKFVTWWVEIIILILS